MATEAERTRPLNKGVGASCVSSVTYTLITTLQVWAQTFPAAAGFKPPASLVLEEVTSVRDRRVTKHATCLSVAAKKRVQKGFA